LLPGGLFGASIRFAKLFLASVDPWMMAGLLYLGAPQPLRRHQRAIIGMTHRRQIHHFREIRCLPCGDDGGGENDACHRRASDRAGGRRRLSDAEKGGVIAPQVYLSDHSWPQLILSYASIMR